MAQSETVERILDAAEQLFAEKGFAETSLRLITSKAGVNLAAVNYHFGSKKSLIQAVFVRFLNPFVSSLEQELDRQRAEGLEAELTLEDLLEMLVKQALTVKPRSGNDLSIFMRLLGLASVRAKAICASTSVTYMARSSTAICNCCCRRLRSCRPVSCSGACISCSVAQPLRCPA